MQKAGIGMIVSAVLIAVGLVLVVVGNQIILEGVSQGNGKVSSNQPLEILVYFDSQNTSTGVFAVQTMELKDNTLSVRVFDPFGIEIISQLINEETVEKDFDIIETGEYKIIIESASNEEIQVFGAIGPVPDAGKKSLGFISIYILIIGMIGLVVVGIYGIKNRKRSV